MKFNKNKPGNANISVRIEGNSRKRVSIKSDVELRNLYIAGRGSTNKKVGAAVKSIDLCFLTTFSSIFFDSI